MSGTVRVLGFDPDLHNSGIAIVERTPAGGFRITDLRIVSISRKLTYDAAVSAMVDALPMERDLPSYDYVVVEGQESYRGSSGPRAKPDDLIRLAHVAGAARREYGLFDDHAEIVAPKVWKGQVPKEIKQARICTKLGWLYEVRSKWCEPGGPGPQQFPHIKGKQWSHVLDAIGLAIWKLDQLAAAGNPASTSSLARSNV